MTARLPSDERPPAWTPVEPPRVRDERIVASAEALARRLDLAGDSEGSRIIDELLDSWHWRGIAADRARSAFEELHARVHTRVHLRPPVRATDAGDPSRSSRAVAPEVRS